MLQFSFKSDLFSLAVCIQKMARGILEEYLLGCRNEEEQICLSHFHSLTDIYLDCKKKDSEERIDVDVAYERVVELQRNSQK